MHHEPLILVGFFPGFNVCSQAIQTLPPHFIQVEPHCAECDPLELVLREGSRKDVVAHLCSHSGAVIDPFLEGFGQFI